MMKAKKKTMIMMAKACALRVHVGVVADSHNTIEARGWSAGLCVVTELQRFIVSY